ncbi:MAG: hypothetical protein KatS3mg105_4452 [Gemmatales bacterium]|nr:MAG: hypothetical protein KatS3mg105_4452 [Gemmatales bacterium]
MGMMPVRGTARNTNEGRVWNPVPISERQAIHLNGGLPFFVQKVGSDYPPAFLPGSAPGHPIIRWKGNSGGLITP